MDIICSQ